jgi:hypothetical protein
MKNCCKKHECNMPAPVILSVETELLRRLSEIEAHISDLESERKAIQRLIIKARNEGSANKDITRRNSLARILIENKILQTLDISENNTATIKILYYAAKSVVPSLKGNTFRSHLHRMNKKGLIEPAHRGGSWRLPVTKS